MLEHVRSAPGIVLDGVEIYFGDASQYWDQIGRFDKLERLQHFREPGDESWEAFAAGDWAEAQKIRSQNRSEIEAEFAEDLQRGIVSRRVRVVALPISPYLYWELHGLKIRAEYGEDIRVVSPAEVVHFEVEGLVPELVLMGANVMYEVRYDNSGTLRGARKFTDTELIEGCREDINWLYQRGEDLRTFFMREIEDLPPPVRVG